MDKSTVRVGQKPSAEEAARIRAELREAKKHPINLDDCPELSAEALKEFALMAKARDTAVAENKVHVDRPVRSPVRAAAL